MSFSGFIQTPQIALSTTLRNNKSKIAVIGGGPAGLRAAEVAAESGAEVTLFDAKASVGRKFLVAGKGGLNLANDEETPLLVKRYTGPGQPADFWESAIGDFDAEALCAWVQSLGVETFAASTGRIYPKELKAAPLLRRWVQRLKGLGVQFAMRHRWVGVKKGAPVEVAFEVDGERKEFFADAVILALGGGSWPETGSDGAWTPILEHAGIGIAPLCPANCGWEFPWPQSVLAVAEGKPLKNIAVRAGDVEVLGELLVTQYGLEGGALYQLGAVLRGMEKPVVTIDFKASSTREQIIAKLQNTKGNPLAHAGSRLKLSEAALAIIEAVGRPGTIEAVADFVKGCPIALTGARPIAEAISSAGGVKWEEVDASLMLRKLPGVFVAGEMVDWEAPTGGYLIQGCFATGTRAGVGALGWLNAQ